MNVLARGNYICAPNAVNDPASASSAFRCPEGMDEVWDFTSPTAKNNSRNWQGSYHFYDAATQTYRPVDGVAVRTWYFVNASLRGYKAPFGWVRGEQG